MKIKWAPDVGKHWVRNGGKSWRTGGGGLGKKPKVRNQWHKEGSRAATEANHKRKKA